MNLPMLTMNLPMPKLISSCSNQIAHAKKEFAHAKMILPMHKWFYPCNNQILTMKILCFIILSPLACHISRSVISLVSPTHVLKIFYQKNFKSVGMTLAKVKEQDGMTLRHAQVSHAPRWSAKYPTSAACHIISQMHHLETERLYNIPYGQSSRKLKLARAEPSKLTTSSGKALETYN